MTNYEYYEQNIKDFLLEHGNVNFGAKDGKLIECCVNDCDKCEINPDGGMCSGLRKKWLNNEYNPYSIPADTPVDTKVLVSNDGEEWFKRYFSHFYKDDPNPYVCFECGFTSWNARGFSHWRYCKLWEGDTTNVNE